MKVSKIGWTDLSGGDLNFITGCTRVSEGCENCYARAIYTRFKRDFAQVRFHPDKLMRLKRRRRYPPWSPKRGSPHKPMCFVCDTGDIFHESVTDRFIHWALDVMTSAACAGAIWQLLTKRPERMRDVIKSWLVSRHVTRLPKNIWIMVTTENQARAMERVPVLMEIPAVVRGISVEPMLEAIDLVAVKQEVERCTGYGYWLDWVICGAESGPNRRPFDVAWAEDLLHTCRDYDIPFFGKQDSGLAPGCPLLLDGSEIKEWPHVS